MKPASFKIWLVLPAVLLPPALSCFWFFSNQSRRPVQAPPPREIAGTKVHQAGGQPGPAQPLDQPPSAEQILRSLSSRAFDRKERWNALLKRLETLLAEGDLEGCAAVLNGVSAGELKTSLVRKFAETASDAQLHDLLNANSAFDSSVSEALFFRVLKTSDTGLAIRYAELRPEHAVAVKSAALRNKGTARQELDGYLNDAVLRHAAICLLAEQPAPLPENVPIHSDLREPQVAHTMAERLFRENVDIMAFAKRFPDSSGRDRLLAHYFSKWLSKDAIAASEWIDSCEDPVIALVGAWQVMEFARGNGDADGAAKWKERVARLRASSGK